jgi:radical SAM superfamily enzyme YgiQ (UPF0313 family)
MVARRTSDAQPHKLYGEAVMLLLINAPMLYVAELNRALASTQIHLLYSFLRTHGVEVQVLDATAELGLPGPNVTAYLERLRARLQAHRFDVAGVSCWSSYQYQGAMQVGRILRDLRPSAPLCVGGYHATALPGDFLASDSPFDWVVQGPGERVLLDVCRRLRRAAAATVVQGSPAPLDEIRYDWSYPYHSGLFLGRGCPHACLFCTDRYAKPVAYGVERALQEYAAAAAHSRDGFVHVFDPCFGLDRRWRRSFLAQLVSLRAPARPHLELRVDMLDEEDLDLLADARARIYLGVESGSAEMLAVMRKARHPRAFLRRCRRVMAGCDARGIDYNVGVLYNHPGERPDTLEQSVDFFWRLVWDGPSERLVRLIIHRYAYFPGAPFDGVRHDFAERLGTRIQHPRWWHIRAVDQRAMSEQNTASATLPLQRAADIVKRLDVANWILGMRAGPQHAPSASSHAAACAEAQRC